MKELKSVWNETEFKNNDPFSVKRTRCKEEKKIDKRINCSLESIRMRANTSVVTTTSVDAPITTSVVAPSTTSVVAPSTTSTTSVVAPSTTSVTSLPNRTSSASIASASNLENNVQHFFLNASEVIANPTLINKFLDDLLDADNKKKPKKDRIANPCGNIYGFTRKDRKEALTHFLSDEMRPNLKCCWLTKDEKVVALSLYDTMVTEKPRDIYIGQDDSESTSISSAAFLLLCQTALETTHTIMQELVFVCAKRDKNKFGNRLLNYIKAEYAPIQGGILFATQARVMKIDKNGDEVADNERTREIANTFYNSWEQVYATKKSNRVKPLRPESVTDGMGDAVAVYVNTGDDDAVVDEMLWVKMLDAL